MHYTEVSDHREIFAAQRSIFGRSHSFAAVNNKSLAEIHKLKPAAKFICTQEIDDGTRRRSIMLGNFMFRLPLIFGVVLIGWAALEIYLSARGRRNKHYSRAWTDKLNRDGE